MAFDEMNGVAFVTFNGEYGKESDFLVFNDGDLSGKQWDTLGELEDNSSWDYVQAIMNGKDLTEWEG